MSATMTATTQKTSKSPCGCGCSGGKTTASGSCGRSECVTCQDRGYTRPLFFAGQLLTEDDLQQLTDYVVAKNRLHTRYLAGSGVVCGLEVICEPCGGGKVIVNPGYALDCCGNDIVLSCPQTLDINKMVRDLKLKLRGGYDCGDPCAESETGGTTQSGGTTASANQTNSRGVTTEPVIAPPPPNPARKYCLYIDYCEQPTDPVSPYATDAPCGPTTCQPTRVHEGFRFELRCPPECEPEPPLCCRICNCIGDRTAFERTVADSEHLQVYGARIMEAWEKLRDNPTLPINNIPHYLNRLADRTLTLKEALTALTNSQLKAKTAESALHSFIDAVFSLGSDIALLRVQPPDIQTQVARTATKETNDVVDEAESTLGAAHQEYASLSRDVISQALPTALEQAHASALFRLVHKLVPNAETSAAKTSKSGAEFRDSTARPYQLTQTSVRFLAAGAVITPHFQSAAADSLAALRDWLLYHLEHSPQTCCDLLREVLAITPPPQTSQDDSTLGDARLIAVASLTLGEAVREVLRSCVCSALNPPCPSCDDPGVLLACLTVQDCQVKNICNMERDFVLTPLAIRYWIPEIQRFGEKIEEWCCQCPCPKDETQKTGRLGSPFPVMESDSPFGRIAEWLLRAACPDLWKSHDARLHDRFSEVILNMQSAQESAKGAPSATVAPATAAIREAVQAATATLEKDLGNALSDLESIRNDHKKLLDRVAHLEKARKPPKGQPEE